MAVLASALYLVRTQYESRRLFAELDRATARLEEIEKAIRVVEKAVDDPKTDEAKLPALQAKLNNLRQEQLNLRRVLAKRA